MNLIRSSSCISISMGKYILAFLCLLISMSSISAQDTTPPEREFGDLDYQDPKSYTVAKLDVIGTESRDKNAIKSIIGVREGNVVTIPSTQLRNGIKKLWDLGIFSDVTLVMDSTINSKRL